MESKLKSLVEFAYENTVFYKEKYKKILENTCVENINFEVLPIVNKSEICNNHYKILSEKSHREFVERSLEKYTTSGSTGICMDIYWSHKDSNNSLIGLWYLRNKYYNISTKDLVCMFYANRTIDGQEMKQMKIGNCLSFSKSNLDNDRIAEIYLRIKEFRPKYMIIEPSVAILLCEYIESNNLDKIDSIEYIELTGEFLLHNVKMKIEKVFGCKTANQYGAYEVNSIAYECPCGNMHIMENNVYVEIIDENGKVIENEEEGDICITSLTNYTMPFIRYNIGDRGRICNNKCNCGNKYPVLELTNGRSNDYILCENGDKIHSSIFMKVIERINEKLRNIILQYQIHQLNFNDFRFDLVLSEEIDMQKLIDAFIKSFDEERLYQLNVTFKFHDELFPNSSTGKLYYFINEMSNG